MPGLGSTGGFAIEIEDIDNLGLPTLNKVGTAAFAQAKADKQLSQVYLPTILTGPYVVANFNRAKALAFGISPTAFFDTMNASTGANFINFFDYGPRSYNVLVQAGAKYRTVPQDLSKIYVANSAGAMMPVSRISQGLDRELERGDHALQRVQRV